MEYLLKSSAVVVLFYLCFSLFLKKETFFQHNRWFLFIGLIIAVIFPSIVIPIHIPIEPLAISEIAYSPTRPTNFVVTQPEATFDWSNVISIIYGTGFVAFLLQFLLQFGSLAMLLLKNPKHKDEQFTYVVIKSKLSPFSFFKWIVYNPDNFEHEELKLILTHEKIHAKQLHSIDILLTQLACVVFWFNPLIWLYRRDVRQNLEYIADYETQQKTKSQKDYQCLLLKTSVANHNISLSNHFYNSLIKERIIMLKKSRSNKKQQWKYLLILPLLAGLLMSMNTEEIYIASKNENKPSLSFTPIGDISKNQRVEIVFTNSMTDDQLEDIKSELKSQGVTMTINSLKRNSKGEIKAIDVDFETKNGSTNYKVKSNKGIDPFYFNMTDDGSFGVGAVQDENHIIETIIVDNLNNPNSIQNKSYSNRTKFYQDSLEIIVEDTLHPNYLNNYKTIINKLTNTITQELKDSLFFVIDTAEVKRLSQITSDDFSQHHSNVKIITNSDTFFIQQPNEKSQIRLNTSNLENQKPLIIVNGKIMSNQALQIINPKHIADINILKGEAATEAYGDKGQNGVVIITTNGESTYISESTSNKKNPWSIRTEVSNVTFIDDEDASKNGSLAYITKHTSDKVLEQHKADLEKFNLKVKFSKVKRNKKGELTSIKISVRNEEGAESSATWKNDDGIPSIEFGKSEGTLVARTSTMN